MCVCIYPFLKFVVWFCAFLLIYLFIENVFWEGWYFSYTSAFIIEHVCTGFIFKHKDLIPRKDLKSAQTFKMFHNRFSMWFKYLVEFKQLKLKIQVTLDYCFEFSLCPTCSFLFKMIVLDIYIKKYILTSFWLFADLLLIFFSCSNIH